MSNLKTKSLAASILSLSLLTVMAGAAVAPAPEIISRHFSDSSRLEVQLIVSMPALFIVTAAEGVIHMSLCAVIMAGMDLAQFLSPFLLSLVTAVFSNASAVLPYYYAAAVSAVFLLLAKAE